MTFCRGGYPCFIQTGGKYTWDYAAGSPITAEDADAGLVQVRRAVDAGLYRARWQRATPLQRQIMRAMADLGGDAATVIAFTVPGMADYVQRQPD